MPSPENNSSNNNEEHKKLEHTSEQEINPEAFSAEKTSELQGSVEQSKISETRFEKIDLPSDELEQAKGEIGGIEHAENEALNDWKETSEAIANSDYEAVKQSWQKAAMEQFEIVDFNLDSYKRTWFDEQELAQAFTEGKDWNMIFEDTSKFTQTESYDMATKSFEAMDELEALSPGSVKKLHEEFGITNFQRYPKEILLNQMAQIDQSKEVGLMIFAANDWNGSMDTEQNLLSKIAHLRKNDLNFRIVECDSAAAMAKQLQSVKQDFEKKISLAILSAHSEPEGFYLGNDTSRGSFVKQEEIAKAASGMKELFSEDAQIVANACSAGAISGWLKDFSKGARVKAVGPDRPAVIRDVEFVGKEMVPRYEKNEIYSGYHNGFLLSKQKKG